uniref:Lipid-binding serum glycoprotein N-terminal domain-containing protein n=1 Tax=Equus asinus asinus TaxID=83772 RepID=A0A8C4PKF8_EQUAS
MTSVTECAVLTLRPGAEEIGSKRRYFIVFCGLLAQTTALLEAVPSPLDPTLPSSMIPDLEVSIPDVPGSLSSALSHGLLSEGLLGSLENLPLSDALKAEGVTSRGLFRGLLGKMVSAMPFLNIIDVKVTNPQMLDLGLVKSRDARGLYVIIPLGMTLNVNVPLVGSLLKLVAKLNVSAQLLPLKDDEYNFYVVLGSCTHSPGSQRGSTYSATLPNSPLFPGQLCLRLTGALSSMELTLVEATVGKPQLPLCRSNDFP